VSCPPTPYGESQANRSGKGLTVDSTRGTARFRASGFCGQRTLPRSAGGSGRVDFATSRRLALSPECRKG
jgi:hypothetical protein